MKRYLQFTITIVFSCIFFSANAQENGHVVLSIDQKGLSNGEYELLRGVRSELGSLFNLAGITTDFRDNESTIQADIIYESRYADEPSGGTPQTVFSDSLFVLSHVSINDNDRVYLKLTIKGNRVHNIDPYYDIAPDLYQQSYMHELAALELIELHKLLNKVPNGKQRLNDLRSRLEDYRQHIRAEQKAKVKKYNQQSFFPIITACQSQEYGVAVLSALPIAGSLVSAGGIVFEASQVKIAQGHIIDAISDSEREHYELEKIRHSRGLCYWIGGEVASLALYGVSVWYSFHRRDDRLNKKGILTVAPSYVPNGVGMAMIYTF